MKSVFERDVEAYSPAIEKRAIEAFKDDLGSGDITTQSVFKKDAKARSVIIAEEDCTLAGVLEARAILEDGGLEVSGMKDGDDVCREDRILQVEGSLKEMLARERVVLNYLSRMSGIATLSNKLFKKYGPRVLFLRKTDPGLLFSEKRAVVMGGCLPHRMNLSDGILIKNNHIAELVKEGDPMAIHTAIMRADGYRKGFKEHMPIEIEVESMEHAEIVANAFKEIKGPNIVMLDNRTPKQVERISHAIRELCPGTIIEASGKITEENMKAYLDAGADYVSTSIFKAARPIGFKMKLNR